MSKMNYILKQAQKVGGAFESMSPRAQLVTELAGVGLAENIIDTHVLHKHENDDDSFHENAFDNAFKDFAIEGAAVMGIGSYVNAKGVPKPISSVIQKMNPKLTDEGIQTAAKKLLPAADKAMLKMGGVGAAAGLAIGAFAGDGKDGVEDAAVGAGIMMAGHAFVKNQHAPTWFHTGVHATQLGSEHAHADKPTKPGPKPKPVGPKPKGSPDYWADDKGNTYTEDPNKPKPKMVDNVKEATANIAKETKEKAEKVLEKVGTSKHVENFKAGKYRKGIGIAGAAVGLYKTLTDTDDDNPISTAANMGIGAGMTYGAGRAAEWIMNDKGAQEAIKQGVKNFGESAVNISKVAKGTDKEEAEKVTNGEVKGRNIKMTRAQAENLKGWHEVTKGEQIPIELKNGKKDMITVSEYEHTKARVVARDNLKKQGMIKKMKNFNGKLGVITAIGATAIGVASVMDVSNEMNHKTREGRMVAYEEENNQQKKQKKKKQNKKAGYGNNDWGQLPIDMFNDRIGHYKMGNAKFQN